MCLIPKPVMVPGSPWLVHTGATCFVIVLSLSLFLSCLFSAWGELVMGSCLWPTHLQSMTHLLLISLSLSDHYLRRWLGASYH